MTIATVTAQNSAAALSPLPSPAQGSPSAGGEGALASVYSLPDSTEQTPASSLWLSVTSYTRLIVGAIGMALGVVVTIFFLLLALPSRTLRIRISNVYGSVIGRWMFWCCGSKLVVTGLEEARARPPAIWAMNHASLMDIPLGIWLSPSGTVGVGKKQVIYYPFFGLLYVLAGHLRIDRGRQQIKKGIAHLAMQTGMPIQPMVTAGTHIAWPKGPPRVVPTTVYIHFPEPLETTDWKSETIDEHLGELEAAFIAVLPPDQRPLRPLR